MNNETAYVNCTTVLREYMVWSSDCNQSLTLFYKLVSLLLAVGFLLPLSINFRAVCLRVIDQGFHVNLNDNNMRLNLLCLCGCLCGVLKASNFWGFHHNDSCVSSVASDLCTAILSCVAYLYIRETYFRLKIMSSPSKRDKGESTLSVEESTTSKKAATTASESGTISSWILDTFVVACVLANGFIFTAVACYHADQPYIVYTTGAVMLLIFSATFCSLIVLLSACSRLCLRSIKSLGLLISKRKEETMEMVSGHYHVKHDPVLETLQKDLQKWKALKIRYMGGACIMTAGMLYQLFAGLSKWSNRYEKDTLVPEEAIYDPMTYSAAVLQIAGYIYVCAIDIVDDSFLWKESEDDAKLYKFRKLRVVQGWILIFPPIPFIYGASLIFNNQGTMIAGIYTAIAVAAFVIIHQWFLVPWDRSEDIDACLNVLKGRKVQLWNFFLITLEAGSFIVVSLDTLFLWWSPQWFQVIGGLFFNAVKVSHTSIEAVFPSLTAGNVTVGVTSLLGLYFLLLIVPQFIGVPRMVIRILNLIGYLLFDILLMSVVSFFIDRLKCQAKVSQEAVLFGNGTFVAFDHIACDDSYNYIGKMDGLLMLIGLLIGFAFLYGTRVRNKATSPRVWDMPAFTGLRLSLKIVIVSAIGVTPGYYTFTPWIRSVINCFCVSALLLFSIVMSPALGPDGGKVNRFRSIMYGIACGFNVASLVSITCKSIAGVAYTIIPVVCFFLFPSLVGLLVWQFPQRWFRDDGSNDTKLVCKLVVEVTDFKEQLLHGTSKEEKLKFYPALALLVNTTFSNNLKEGLGILQQTMGTRDNLVESLAVGGFHMELQVKLLKTLQSACKYPIGVKAVFREHIHTVVGILESSTESLRLMTPSFCQVYESAAESDRVLNRLQQVLRIYKEIIPRCSNILIAVMKHSKHYKNAINSKYPQLFPTLAHMLNCITCMMSLNRCFPHSESVAIIQSIHLLLNTMSLARKAGTVSSSTKTNDLKNSMIFAFDLFGVDTFGDNFVRKAIEVFVCDAAAAGGVEIGDGAARKDNNTAMEGESNAGTMERTNDKKNKAEGMRIGSNPHSGIMRANVAGASSAVAEGKEPEIPESDSPRVVAADRISSIGGSTKTSKSISKVKRKQTKRSLLMVIDPTKSNNGERRKSELVVTTAVSVDGCMLIISSHGSAVSGPSAGNDNNVGNSLSPSSAVSHAALAESAVNGILERANELYIDNRLIFQGRPNQHGTCFICVGLLGASDELAMKVQDAWYNRLSHTHTGQKERRMSKGNKVHTDQLSIDLLLKVDLMVVGVPLFANTCHDASLDEDTNVSRYLKGVYNSMERSFRGRIRSVRDNQRLWVTAGIQ